MGRIRRTRGRRPLQPNREASEFSPRHPRELSPVSQISRRHYCLLARSLSQLAGSDPASAPPPPGALGPRSPAPRMATLPISAIGLRACPCSHGTAPQGHPWYVSEPRRVPMVARSVPTVF
ncbi:hypothetical protein NDU88_006203 [Pleurodeles waltl]|uniref:Uncharacterized protein n=1 Tax=Pleurodeles waltl TaxID=8319 RepID=A0AAV7PL50_PLEWA|nr:hypothetical protein NDU88_006203 [Pleurodeles waltl]